MRAIIMNERHNLPHQSPVSPNNPTNIYIARTKTVFLIDQLEYDCYITNFTSSQLNTSPQFSKAGDAAEMFGDESGTCARGTRGLELRDGLNKCHTNYEVSKTGNGSSNVWEWKNSVSKRNRGMGLRDASFWRKFESVMWKEGDHDRMTVENMDEVEGTFFCTANFV